jgi:hypothetical protein
MFRMPRKSARPKRLESKLAIDHNDLPLIVLAVTPADTSSRQDLGGSLQALQCASDTTGRLALFLALKLKHPRFAGDGVPGIALSIADTTVRRNPRAASGRWSQVQPKFV